MATVSTGTQTNIQDLRASDHRAKPFSLLSGHSGRLRYAQPQDLPSFPSLGLKKDDAAASAAASLGWASARPRSLCTPPEHQSSAQRAGVLADDDHNMSASSQSHRGLSGPPNKAAVLAASNASRPKERKSMPASMWGNAAATQAFAAAGSAEKVGPRAPMTDLNRQKSLRAAEGAFAGSGRPRSKSSPQTYPDSENAAANALSAATVANRPGIFIRMEDAGAVPLTTMDRQMYTTHPPVRPEVDERNREASLHASAVAMAKTMYAHQQKAMDAAKQTQGQHGEMGDSRSGSTGTDGAQQPTQFASLQEAAYKLAQERLSRLRDEHQQNRELAEYYGTSPTSPTSPGRKLTRMTRARRRASSDGDLVASPGDDDRQQSRRIRKQMSMFSTRLDEVDAVKRSRDREALLAAAQRNVKATLEGMDEKMYRETGRIAPAKLNEWEQKAHAAAQTRSEARMGADRTGQVDLGAGQYMDRDKVNDIAAKRVQPVLDEINEKAELERERLMALKVEQEKRRLERESEKAKNIEDKEAIRRLKEEDKLRKEELKQEAKARKEAEKAARAEEKRLAREEKGKGRDDHGITAEDPVSQSAEKSSGDEPITPRKHRIHRPFTPKIQTKGAPTDIAVTSPATSSPESANESQATRVKNWLKSRLTKPRAKSLSTNKSDKQPGGFIGGAALMRLHADGTGSLTSLSEGNRSASMREVALAGRPAFATPSAQIDEVGERSGAPRHREGGSVSSLSSEGTEVGRARARARTVAALEGIEAPKLIADPAGILPRNSGSPERNSKFIEIIE